MSQLIDQLNRVAKPTPQPLGFRASRAPSARPQMLLVAFAKTDNPNALAGADALLVSITETNAKATQKLVRALPDIPWGAWLKDNAKDAPVVSEAGADFVVFSTAAEVSATLQKDKLGKILQAEPSQSEGLLRAINDLPVDAVLMADESPAGPFTWQQLMLLQRGASLLTKPLLVSIAADLNSAELEVLWEMGVDGLVVTVSSEQPDRLKELRQAIAKLPDSTRRKRGKVEALVPSVRMETSAELQEEEEGEDE